MVTQVSQSDSQTLDYELRRARALSRLRRTYERAIQSTVRRSAGVFDDFTLFSQESLSEECIPGREVEPGNEKVEYERDPISVSSTERRFGKQEVYKHEVFVNVAGEIIKRRHPRISEIDFDVLTKLRAKGLPIPRLTRLDRETIKIDRIPGPFGEPVAPTFGEYVQQQIYSGALGSPEQALERFNQFISDSIDRVAQLDDLVSEVLSPKQKRYLNLQRLRKFKGTRLAPSSLIQRAFAYNGQDNGGSYLDRSFLGLFRPVEQEFRRGMKKYGAWTLDSKPRNLVVDAMGQINFIDGDHPQKSLIQLEDTLLFDAYIPVKQGLFTGLNAFTTPFSDYPGDESQKIELVRRMFEARNKHSKRKFTDFDDYLKYYYVARVINSTREVGKTIGNIRGLYNSWNEDYNQIYEGTERVRHYAINALGALAVLERKYGIKTRRLAEYLSKKIDESAFVSDEDLEDAKMAIHGELEGCMQKIARKYQLVRRPASEREPLSAREVSVA